MQRHFAAIVIAAALLGAPTLAFADAGHAHFSAGVPGNPKKPARTIEVLMKEGDGKMEYVPSRIEVKRNEQIRFVLKNVGELRARIRARDQRPTISSTRKR